MSTAAGGKRTPLPIEIARKRGATHPIFLLTSYSLMSILVDMSQMYSTAQVATAIGVSKKTLLRWLWSGKVAEPKQTVGSLESRVWTQADLNRAKLYREQNYRKRS